MYIRVPRVGVACTAGAVGEVGVAARSFAQGPAKVCGARGSGGEHVDLLKRVADVATHVANKVHLALQIPASAKAVAHALDEAATCKVARHVIAFFCDADHTASIAALDLGLVVQSAKGIGGLVTTREIQVAIRAKRESTAIMVLIGKEKYKRCDC